MQHLMNEQQQKQEVSPQPLRGFLLLLIGGEEILLFGGFLFLSWLASSPLFYALEASLFLVALGLMQILLVWLIFHRTSPLRERLLASFRLLPSWEGMVSFVALAHCVIAGFCVALVILGSLMGIMTFPTYWWDVGSRFLLVSADLSLLFPLALKAMAAQGERALKMKWFLLGWTLLLLGWLIGGLLDFQQRNFPPKMIVACAWGAVLILLLVYWTCFRRSSQGKKTFLL